MKNQEKVKNCEKLRKIIFSIDRGDQKNYVKELFFICK